MATQLPTEQALNYVGTLGCAIVVVMFAGPLSAIKTVLKDKSTASLPFSFTAASFVNCALWTTYGWSVLNVSASSCSLLTQLFAEQTCLEKSLKCSSTERIRIPHLPCLRQLLLNRHR
jgi:uncharacterized protein with PQ loop repeat